MQVGPRGYTHHRYISPGYNPEKMFVAKMASADVIRLVGTTEHQNKTIHTSKVFRLVHLPTQKTKKTFPPAMLSDMWIEYMCS